MKLKIKFHDYLVYIDLFFSYRSLELYRFWMRIYDLEWASSYSELYLNITIDEFEFTLRSKLNGDFYEDFCFCSLGRNI